MFIGQQLPSSTIPINNVQLFSSVGISDDATNGCKYLSLWKSGPNRCSWSTPGQETDRECGLLPQASSQEESMDHEYEIRSRRSVPQARNIRSLAPTFIKVQMFSSTLI
jgi:hypothetical protein